MFRDGCTRSIGCWAVITQIISREYALVRQPDGENWEADDLRVVCCTAFLRNQEIPGTAVRFVDMCDPQSIGEIIEDSRQGNAGLMRGPYEGVDSLWAYGSSKQGGGFPILIVPYQRIVEQANSAQQMLFRDNIRAMQIATILVFGVIVAAVFLAVMRARNVTVPITHLADAATRLAQGDFEATVNIRTNDELQQLGDVFNQTGPRLKAMEKMKMSLELAGAIQHNLLPKIPPKLDAFELAGRCEYCDETGGDYYDFVELTELGPGKVGIALGDVTGHGIGAALLMAAARSVFKSNAHHYGADLPRLFTVLNKHLEDDTDDDKFITLFYGVLDARQRSLVWASGGHDPALWYRKDENMIEELASTGPPVGVMDNATFEEGGPVSIGDGDIVLIGTDGIWETQNEGGDMFGKARLHDIITRESSKSAEAICSRVTEEVAKFRASSPQLDDVTVVVLKSVSNSS